MKFRRPERICLGCKRPFFPARPHSKTHGRKCASKWLSEQRKGKLSPALAPHISAKTATTRAALRAEFGELSVREIAVFKWAWKRAYQRGYNHTYYRKVRTEAA